MTLNGEAEMNDTVAASVGTWINVFILFFLLFFFFPEHRHQDWTFLSKEHTKWHQCYLVGSWAVVCSRTPGCSYLVSDHCGFWFVFGDASGENSTERCWGLSGGASFKTWRTLFCILDNNAFVQQGCWVVFLWFLSLQTKELINLTRLQCKLLTETKFSCLHRATFWPCVVQGCKYFPSKSLLFQFTLHSVTMLISVMGRFCMVGTKRGPSLGCGLLPALSCIVKWTLSP